MPAQLPALATSSSGSFSSSASLTGSMFMIRRSVGAIASGSSVRQSSSSRSEAVPAIQPVKARTLAPIAISVIGRPASSPTHSIIRCPMSWERSVSITRSTDSPERPNASNSRTVPSGTSSLNRISPPSK